MERKHLLHYNDQKISKNNDIERDLGDNNLIYPPQEQMSTVISKKNKVNMTIVSVNLRIIICNIIPSKIYNL